MACAASLASVGQADLRLPHLADDFLTAGDNFQRGVERGIPVARAGILERLAEVLEAVQCALLITVIVDGEVRGDILLGNLLALGVALL